jgi:hypothetical protein
MPRLTVLEGVRDTVGEVDLEGEAMGWSALGHLNSVVLADAARAYAAYVRAVALAAACAPRSFYGFDWFARAVRYVEARRAAEALVGEGRDGQVAAPAGVVQRGRIEVVGQPAGRPSWLVAACWPLYALIPNLQFFWPADALTHMWVLLADDVDGCGASARALLTSYRDSAASTSAIDAAGLSAAVGSREAHVAAAPSTGACGAGVRRPPVATHAVH